MARPAKSEFQQLQEVAYSMEQDLLTMSRNPEYGTDIQDELRQLSHYARIIREKLPKIENFASAVIAGFKFAVVGEDGQLRPATREEAQRLIMGYKTGNVIDIYDRWTVVNGEWVERPRTNPDGSLVRRDYQ